MAYTEVTPANRQAVVDAIATAALAAGWTINRQTTVGGQYTLTISRAGSDFIHIYLLSSATSYRVYMRVSAGYTAANTAQNQPNVSHYTHMDLQVAGPYVRMYIFTDNAISPHIHFVVETEAGVFFHGSVGLLIKYGSYTGGTYAVGTHWYTEGQGGANNPESSGNNGLFGQNPSVTAASALGAENTNSAGGIIRVDYDSRTNNFVEGSNSTTTVGFFGGADPQLGNANRTAYLPRLFDRSQNNFASTVPLIPVPIFVSRPSGFFSWIGEPPNFRCVNLARFAPGDEFTVGSDTWKVFPWIRKGTGTSTQRFSGNYGYAYRKVV